MKVLVEDANVLLDLVNGDVLGLWLGAGFENSTTVLVWQEVSHTTQQQKVQPFIDSGLLTIHDIPPTSWHAIAAFSVSAGVSISDASVWLLAKSEKATLLTGDSKLRSSARVSGVEVRGILWVLDELVAQGKLEPKAAAVALNKMVEGGAFLPLEECRTRMDAWTLK
ncbi:MAG TPA: hypothetical protein VF585_07660 [Chthoniobacterales bacterium]|jgi:predicted nucleic acid-binding protein